MYKGTSPTCHDFNSHPVSAGTPPSDGSSCSTRLLTGFSGGQVQLLDPIKKELSKLYNEEVSNNLSP